MKVQLNYNSSHLNFDVSVSVCFCSLLSSTHAIDAKPSAFISIMMVLLMVGTSNPSNTLAMKSVPPAT